MRLAICGVVLALLAGCGADGEPEVPAPPPGVTLSGSVEFGVTGGI